jgi:gamma-glutamyltranspeptidase
VSQLDGFLSRGLLRLFSSKRECVAIDAREAAPSNAHQRMFVDGNPPPSSVSGKTSGLEVNNRPDCFD